MWLTLRRDVRPWTLFKDVTFFLTPEVLAIFPHMGGPVLLLAVTENRHAKYYPLQPLPGHSQLSENPRNLMGGGSFDQLHLPETPNFNPSRLFRQGLYCRKVSLGFSAVTSLF